MIAESRVVNPFRFELLPSTTLQIISKKKKLRPGYHEYSNVGKILMMHGIASHNRGKKEPTRVSFIDIFTNIEERYESLYGSPVRCSGRTGPWRRVETIMP